MTDQAEKPEVAEEKKASNRRKYRNDDWTDEQVQSRFAELTVEAVPQTDDGRPWVKLAEVANAFRTAGIPISRLVRATGGDRGMNPPVNPLWQIVYVGRTRYMNPDVLTTGIKAMQEDPALATTPRKPREKKEKAEGDGETGPVKSSKRGRKAEKKAESADADTPAEKVWEFKG